MNGASQKFWVKVLLGLAAVAFVPVMVRAVDDLIQGNTSGFGVQAFVLTVVVLSTLYLFGILWSWQGRVYGYVIVGLYAFRCSVAFTNIPEQRGYAETVAGSIEVWTPVFVGPALSGGVLTLATTIVAAYLCPEWWKARRLPAREAEEEAAGATP